VCVNRIAAAMLRAEEKNTLFGAMFSVVRPQQETAVVLLCFLLFLYYS
jgi:hypothetical protein